MTKSCMVPRRLIADTAVREVRSGDQVATAEALGISVPPVVLATAEEMVEWTRPVKSLRPLGSDRQCLGPHVTSGDRARATPERIRRARGRSMPSGHPAACRLAKPRADRDAKGVICMDRARRYRPLPRPRMSWGRHAGPRPQPGRRPRLVDRDATM